MLLGEDMTTKTLRSRIVTRPNALRRQRVALRMTQKQVAGRADVSLSQYKNIETGRNGTTEETGIRISDVLRSDFMDLFEFLPGTTEGKVRNEYRQAS